MLGNTKKRKRKANMCVITYFDDKADAIKMGTEIINAGLAAYVNITEGTALYKLKGQNIQEKSYDLTCIVDVVNLDKIILHIENNHPDEVPHIVSFDIES